MAVLPTLSAAHAALPFSAVQHPMVLPPDITLSRAVDAINALQAFYNQTTGLWNSTGWWNSGNCLTVYAEYVAFSHSIQNEGFEVFSNTLEKAQNFNISMVDVISPKRYQYMIEQSAQWVEIPGNGNATRDGTIGSNGKRDNVEVHLPFPSGLNMPSAQSFPGFINDFYDDEAWWALGWLQAWEATNKNETRYLSMAESIFEDIRAGWSDGTTNLTSCQGIWWDKGNTAINAIENELFITLSASLANRILDKKDYYLDWALKVWSWFQGTGMITEKYSINDGINLTTCKNNGLPVWTYNQGVILGALVELHIAKPNTTLIDIASNIANKAIDSFTDQATGVIKELCDPYCGSDGQQFKGVFIRNLYKLWKQTGTPLYLETIQKNAESIYANDRGEGNYFGPAWGGPYIAAQSNAGSHSSASDAIVAAAMAVGVPT